MVRGYQLLGVENLGVQVARRVRPAAVQVRAGKVAAVIAYNHTVRVQHRNDFEDKRVAKQLGVLVVLLQQEIDCALDHELRVALTGVDPGLQKDYLLLAGHGRVSEQPAVAHVCLLIVLTLLGWHRRRRQSRKGLVWATSRT